MDTFGRRLEIMESEAQASTRTFFFVFIGCKSSFLDTSVTQTCFPSLMFSFIVDRYSYCCYSFSGKSPICWFLLKAAVCSGVHKGCIPRLA